MSSLLENTPGVIAAIFGLGLSIFVHELGHFLAARKRGLKVLRFSIGMGPKLFSWNKDGVEYRISALPLGGYVALPQLADMGRLEGGNEDENFENEEILPPISFLDKFIVSVMGAVFNFIFAFLLALIIWGTGEPSTEEMQTTEIGYVYETLYTNKDGTIPGPAYEAGIRAGDNILEIDDSPVDSYIDIQQKILTGFGRDENGNPQTKVLVERNGEKLTYNVHCALDYINNASKEPIRRIGFEPADEIVIGEVSQNSPAEAAGLQPGDIIHSVNGIDIRHLQTFVDLISDKENLPARLHIQRNGEFLDKTLNPVTVATTKPLLIAKLVRNGRDASFIVRPDFTETSNVDKTDSKSPSALIVHQILKDEAKTLDHLRSGDRIVAVNGGIIESLQDVADAFQVVSGPVMQLTVARSGGTQSVPIVFTKITTEIKPPYTQPMIGFSAIRKTITTHINPLKQFGKQIDLTVRILQALFHRGSEIGIGHLSGPIGIVRELSDMSRIDFRLAIKFLILLNVNLGILNLLPIPILDGGHILFAVIGKIRRKTLPLKLVASIQGVFMILLLSLMMYVIFKDGVRWFGDSQQASRSELYEKIRIDPVFVNEE